MTKDKQKFERELSSIQDKEKQFCSANLILQDKVESLTEQHLQEETHHKSLKQKYKQFEKMYEELKSKYKTTNSTLEKVNKERQKLLEDAIRSERIIKGLEEQLGEINKAFELEKNNYGTLLSLTLFR